MAFIAKTDDKDRLEGISAFRYSFPPEEWATDIKAIEKCLTFDPLHPHIDGKWVMKFDTDRLEDQIWSLLCTDKHTIMGSSDRKYSLRFKQEDPMGEDTESRPRNELYFQGRGIDGFTCGGTMKFTSVSRCEGEYADTRGVCKVWGVRLNSETEKRGA